MPLTSKSNLLLFFSVSTIFNIFPTVSFAQLKFQKQFAFTNLHEAQQTADSGFIAAGWYMFPQGESDICLIKTDSNGDTLWTKTYGETENAVAISMDVTRDNGYIITGSTYINPPDSTRIYVIRTNSNGDTLWTKKYGGIGNQDSRCIHETMDGGFIISGETTSFGAGNHDMYVIKLDSIGNVTWSRTIGTPINDYCYSIYQTADSGYIALGTLGAFSVNSDVALVRMNSQGDTLWTKIYSGTGIGQDKGFRIIENLDHGFTIAGTTTSFGPVKPYLMVTDSVGNLLWAKTYGGTTTTWGYSFLQKANGNYVLCGNTSAFGIVETASYVIETDVNGNVIWSKVYEDTYGSVAFSIFQTFDGGYITAGEENELMKLNAAGSSGCLEMSVNSITTNISLPSVYTFLLLTHPNTITYPTQTIVGQGIVMVDLCTSVGMDENFVTESSILVFPNPASDFVNIQLNGEVENASLTIYNSLGKLVFTEEINSSQTRINCEQFTDGFYLLKFRDGMKSIIKKMIINKS